MTVAPTTQSAPSLGRGSRPTDHRGSPIPTGAMIATRLMELRKRRGLMTALIVVFIGLPTIFLGIRLIMHAVNPKAYSPAGGYDVFNNVVDGVLFIFGFIVAATLGCFAGSVDLTEGVFRHLVVTGRSRVALYLARIPAGLAILVPLVAVGFTILCAVCVFAAPPRTQYNGENVPSGLSRGAFVSWAEGHPGEVLCSFPSQNIPYNVPCTSTGMATGKQLPPGVKLPSKAKLQEIAGKIANQNYSAYKGTFRVPPVSLMIETGLWILLEATLGFVIGLGLSSLMGQRTVPVVILIVFELDLDPASGRPYDRPPHQRPARFGRGSHGPDSAKRIDSRVRRSERSRRPDEPAHLTHGGGLCHHRLDRRMDCARSVAHGETRRLSEPRSRS